MTETPTTDVTDPAPTEPFVDSVPTLTTDLRDAGQDTFADRLAALRGDLER